VILYAEFSFNLELCVCIFQAYAAAGTVNQNYANILLMLLRLRQACDHPFLVKDYKSDSVGKDSVEMAKRLPRDMLINLMNCLETSFAICRVCNVSFLKMGYLVPPSPQLFSAILEYSL
jgi:SNF2 family DNA or RNA helicase